MWLVITSQTKDKEREQYIRNIKLEKNFYNSFRNTIRILLGNPENSEIRQELEKLVNNEFLLYFKKIDDVEKLLKELTSNAIQFILYTDDLKNKLDEISSCIVKDENKCKSDNYCLFSEGDVCNLLIPKDNLLTGVDNEKHYFERISDCRNHAGKEIVEQYEESIREIERKIKKLKNDIDEKNKRLKDLKAWMNKDEVKAK